MRGVHYSWRKWMAYIASSPETTFIVRKICKIYTNYCRLAQCFNGAACKVYETNLQNEKTSSLLYREALAPSFPGFDGLSSKSLQPAAPPGDCNHPILAQWGVWLLWPGMSGIAEHQHCTDAHSTGAPSPWEASVSVPQGAWELSSL